MSDGRGTEKSGTAGEDVGWFRDLRAGTGRASALDPALRDVLVTALSETAEDQSRHEAEQRRGAEESEREATRQARREEAQWRGGLNVAITGAAFRLVPVRLVIGAVLVLFTPMGASFATISPAGDSIRDVVFFPGETGSTAGSGPFTLYSILFWVTIAALVSTFVLDLVFGPPEGASAPVLAVVGALVGVVIFIALWSANALGGSSWAIAPGALVVGYTIQCLVSGARRHTPIRTAVTARALLDR